MTEGGQGRDRVRDERERDRELETEKDRRGEGRQTGRETRETESERERARVRAGKRQGEGKIETDRYVTADFDGALFHQIPVTPYSCPRRGPIVTREWQPAALVVLITPTSPPTPFSSRLPS